MEHFARKIGFFREEKIEFDLSVDVTKCRQHDEIHDLLHMCATCSELPSDISTMVFTEQCKRQVLKK